jgi:tRNA(Arg) A34 adenosine deaminase TadA
MVESLPGKPSSRRHFLAGLALGGCGGAAGFWLLQRYAHSTHLTSPVPPNSLDHDRFMRLAVAQAQKVPELPFGAVIVDARKDEVLAEGHNRSKESPTFHGEIDAINRLAAQQSVSDWSPLILYTTAEPCPMCQSAIEWAGIGLVVYGSSIPFLKELGWWQIDIRAEEVIQRTPFRKTAIIGGVLADECNQLFLAVPKGMYRGGK